MAGIGFELKKLFRGESIISKVRAYSYTGLITTGPMILGILFLLMLTWTGRHFGMAKADLDLCVTMVTYSLLFSILVSGIFSMIESRYTADMLYAHRTGDVLSSFYGVLCVLLPAGGLLYGIFLILSGISPMLILLDFILFMILLVVWTEMNYLTAIKNYKGILLGFLLAIAVSFVSAWIISAVSGPSAEILIGCCGAGYGVMMISDMVLLHQFFPDAGRKPFLYLRWFDRYGELAWTGFLMNIGLYAHLFIAWHGQEGVKIRGFFYAAPVYDVPALFAFLTILITTINFVVSTEVHFYPVYRSYYDLFNGTGSIDEIERAETQMMDVLESELTYLARMQFLMTVLMIAIGPMILESLPLGFTGQMSSYFRILCVGYGAYAVGNVLMMILMYFADDKGAMRSSIVFAVVTTAASAASQMMPVQYYGFGFALGSIVYLIYGWRRLSVYTRHLGYYILSTQPVVARSVDGPFTRIEKKLDG